MRGRWDHSATNPIQTHWHATGVAGTMGAGGVLQFTLNGQPARLLHGVAYEAAINEYRFDPQSGSKIMEAARA